MFCFYDFMIILKPQQVLRKLVMEIKYQVLCNQAVECCL